MGGLAGCLLSWGGRRMMRKRGMSVINCKKSHFHDERDTSVVDAPYQFPSAQATPIDMGAGQGNQ